LLAEEQMTTKPGYVLVYDVYTWKFYRNLIITFIVVLGLNWLAPKVLPFGIFGLFYVKFDLAKLATIPWFLLLVGPGLAILHALLTKRARDENLEIVEKTREAVRTSILCGIFEEVKFRWLRFFLAIYFFWGIDTLTKAIWTSDLWQISTKYWWLSIPVILVALVILNFAALIGSGILQDETIRGLRVNLVALIVLLAGIAVDIAIIALVGWSWIKWVYDVAYIPVVNLITQGRLSELLTNYGWATAAALVSVNWTFGFGGGHNYEGPIGMINAWIIGMIMFWMVFNFGLPIAMLVHAGYDVLLNVIETTDAVSELGSKET